MRRILTSILCLSLLMGCKNKHGHKDDNTVSSVETNSIDTLQLKLDNGKKWLANFETQLGVEKMDSIISSYKVHSTQDYRILGDKLSEQTGYIIKNCTMKGESHDQLHVVLVPMLEQISTLKESENISKLEQAKSNLEVLIDKYKDYFKYE